MDAKALSSAISKFSARFCNELPKDQSTVSSPLSAEILLALLALGSSDEGHNELLTSLGIPDDDSIRSSFTDMSAQLRDIKGVTFDIANKIYIKDGGYDLHSDLKEDAVKVFNAAFEKISFDNGAVAAETINKWVESKTNNRIKDLLKGDSLNTDTRLVLVNALYFKGSWKTQFNPESTSTQPFHLTASTQIEVPMMYQESRFKYGESQELQAQILEMPYENEQASMIVILPSEIEGLNGLISKLAGGYELSKDLDRMIPTKVRVHLPKFKIETEIDLKAILPKLGITRIFDQNSSDLTKVLNVPEPLFVSKAVQKAFIEVNEQGAEAAAATGMVMMLKSMPMTPMFFADRPFLLLLTAADKTLLFVGAYRGV